MNDKTQLNLGPYRIDDSLVGWVDAFLADREAQGLSDGTLRFYQQKLKLLTNYCASHSIDLTNQITANFIRQYLVDLEQTGHNPGGKHAAFRVLRAFLNWYENEAEPEGWGNPIHKVKAPKVPVERLEPVSIEAMASMVRTCRPGTFAGDRDKAIMLFLFDTGIQPVSSSAWISVTWILRMVAL